MSPSSALLLDVPPALAAASVALDLAEGVATAAALEDDIPGAPRAAGAAGVAGVVVATVAVDLDRLHTSTPSLGVLAAGAVGARHVDDWGGLVSLGVVVVGFEG